MASLQLLVSISYFCAAAAGPFSFNSGSSSPSSSSSSSSGVAASSPGRETYIRRESSADPLAGKRQLFRSPDNERPTPKTSAQDFVSIDDAAVEQAGSFWGSSSAAASAALLTSTAAAEKAWTNTSQRLFSLADTDWRQLDKEISCKVLVKPVRLDQTGRVLDHDLHCPPELMMTSLHLSHNTSKAKVFHYTCCKLGQQLGTCQTKRIPFQAEGINFLATRGHEIACAAGQGLVHWQLKTEHSRQHMLFKCCHPGHRAQFGTCKDIVTSSKGSSATATGDLSEDGSDRGTSNSDSNSDSNSQGLGFQNLQCDRGSVLTGWKYLVAGEESRLRHTCCPVGKVMDLGKVRHHCSWNDRQVFSTFGGTEHMVKANASGETSWVFKNPYVQVQALYRVGCVDCPESKRGVAIAGPFLKGHKLTVLRSIRLGEDALPALESQVFWDDHEVLRKGGKFDPEGVNVRLNAMRSSNGDIFTAFLPLGVSFKMSLGMNSSDSFLTIKDLPGGQQGHCVDSADDTSVGRSERTLDDRSIEELRKVPEDEDFFLTEHHGVSGESSGRKYEDCTGPGKHQAQTSCSAQVVGGEHADDFRDICTYNSCWNAVSLEEATTSAEGEATEEQEQEDQEGVPQDLLDDGDSAHETMETEDERQSGRQLFLGEPSSMWGVAQSCGPGKELAMPRSHHEHRACADVLASHLDDSTKLVRLGGSWNATNQRWQWLDGSPVCGYENWASGEGDIKSSPDKNSICMSTEDFKWYQCSDFEQLNMACADTHSHLLMHFAPALEARSSCGHGRQLAMPKSHIQHLSLLDVVQKDIAGSDNFAWLGARYVNNEWLWEDGSKVCGFTNWAKDEPDHYSHEQRSLEAGEPAESDATLFLCMHLGTGKWHACPGYAERHYVVCEATMQEQTQARSCPPGAIPSSNLKMTVWPFSTVGRYHGYCYYFAEAKKDCEETCVAQLGTTGYCSVPGLKAAAKSTHVCSHVVQHLVKPGSVRMSEVDTGSNGCSYVDTKWGKQIIVEHKGHRHKEDPSCTERSAHPNWHRVCACAKGASVSGTSWSMGSSSKLPYPVGGQRIRIEGTPSDTELWSIQLQTSSNAIIRFLGNPVELVCEWIDIYRSTSSVPELVAMYPWTHGVPMTVDLELDGPRVNIYANGRIERQMSHKVRERLEVVSVTSTGLSGTALSVLEAADGSVGFNSRNGCKSHHLSMHSDLLTIDFTAHFRRTDGTRCIRCAKRGHGGAPSVKIRNGKLLFEVVGNAPKTIEFFTKLDEKKDYKITISYQSRERLVDLYLEDQLVETRPYSYARKARVRSGLLGCKRSWAEKLDGFIEGFTMKPVYPPTRPLAARCTRYTCPRNYARRKDHWNRFCPGATCTSRDTDLCCEKAAPCSSYKCAQGTERVAHAWRVYCDGPECLGEAADATCCRPKGSCETYHCPKEWKPRPFVRDLFCSRPDCDRGRDPNHEDTRLCCELVATCRSYQCPGMWVHKDKALSTPCATDPCTDADLHTCCGKRGKCSSFVCPTNYKQKVNAKDIWCSDPECLTTDWSTCCAEAGHCSTMTCPEGYVNEKTFHWSDGWCTDTVCDVAKDRDRCCIQRATCDTLACPKGYVPKPGQEKALCRGFKCHQKKDTDTCCVPMGRCDAFQCPKSYNLRGNAKELRCDDLACKETPFEQCCAKAGVCSTVACPADEVLRAHPDEITCYNKTACTLVLDQKRCCEKRARCSADVCAKGTVVRENAPWLLCKGANCFPGVDQDTCCVKPAMCSSFTCPVGYLPLANADKIPCSDQMCAKTRVDKCCGEQHTCSAYTCPTGMSLRPQPEKIHCEGFQCGPRDLDRCCDPSQRCSEFTMCPKNWLLKADAGSIYCAGHECKESEYQTCCDQLGKCSTYNCPIAYAHRQDAEWCNTAGCNETDFHTCCAPHGTCATLECPWTHAHRKDAGNVTCDRYVCDSRDVNKCCDEKMTCDHHICPDGSYRRPNAERLFCSDSNCTVEDDATCCAVGGTCSALVCPTGWAHRSGADNIFCSTPVCDGKDFRRCCAPLETCATRDCPAGYQYREFAKNLYCGPNCADAQWTEACCHKVQHCGNYQLCTGTLVLRPNPEDLLCGGPECTIEDQDTCCAETGTCGAYTCPAGYLPMENATSIQCVDEKCVEKPSNTQNCCSKAGICKSITCPAGYHHRLNALDSPCNGWTCNEEDVTHCCQKSPSCSNYQCEDGLVKRPDANQHFCSEDRCTSVDSAECCIEAGYCTGTTCPYGYLLRQNASKIQCAGHNCSSTPVDVCCVERPSCAQAICPLGKVHSSYMDELYCYGYECTDSDVELCCDDLAKCNTLECPIGFTHIANASNVSCAFSTCLEREASTCCVEAGNCTMMTCPSGYTYKADYDTIFCTDTLCQDTSYEVCCDEQPKCTAYSCPDGHVPRDDQAITYCFGGDCSLDENLERCCDKIATCDTYSCPTGFLRRLNASSIRCKWSDCSDYDLHDCCYYDGTCSAKECPSTMVRRHNAHEIKCKGIGCADSPDSLCCAKEGTCTSMRCPVGTAHRAAAENITCMKRQCIWDDEPTCCEAAATCDTIECGTGWNLRLFAPYIFCESSPCGESERSKCCEANGNCDSFVCPTKYGLKWNAGDLSCPDKECTESLETIDTCCALEGTCGTLPCPSTHTRKEGASGLSCADSTMCTENDVSTCCDARASCDSMVCPSGFVDASNKSSLFCEGSTCTDGDELNCCVERASCSNVECPNATIHKECSEFSDSICRCSGVSCNETDVLGCCAAKASCSDFECPSSAYRVSGTCATPTCTSSDQETCCKAKALCSTMSCPSGMTACTGSSCGEYCAGSSCNVKTDNATCCVQETTTTPGPSSSSNSSSSNSSSSNSASRSAAMSRLVGTGNSTNSSNETNETKSAAVRPAAGRNAVAAASLLLLLFQAFLGRH